MVPNLFLLVKNGLADGGLPIPDGLEVGNAPLGVTLGLECAAKRLGLSGRSIILRLRKAPLTSTVTFDATYLHVTAM